MAKNSLAFAKELCKFVLYFACQIDIMIICSIPKGMIIMVKSILKAVLALVLMFTLAFNLAFALLPPIADGQVEFSFTGLSQITAGQNIVYTLRAGNISCVANGVAGFSTDFYYDSGILTITSASSPLSGNTDFSVAINTDIPGKITFVAVSSQKITGDSQNLLSVTFAVSQTATDGQLAQLTFGDAQYVTFAPSYIEYEASVQKMISEVVEQDAVEPPPKLYIEIRKV